jgi:hypothetical protein
MIENQRLSATIGFVGGSYRDRHELPMLVPIRKASGVSATATSESHRFLFGRTAAGIGATVTLLRRGEGPLPLDASSARRSRLAAAGAILP